MIKSLILVVVLIGCITLLTRAYGPYHDTQLDKVHALWAEQKTKSLAPRLKARIHEIETSLLLTSDIKFKFDLTRYDAEDSPNVMFVWEDMIYADHGGTPPRPTFAYEEDFQDLLRHFRQYEDLKRISRELDEGITDSFAKKGKEALAYIDGLASRYVVIGKAANFRYPDPRAGDIPSAVMEAEFYVVDTRPDKSNEESTAVLRLEERVLSADGAVEVIAFGKTRVSPAKPMIRNPKFARRQKETPEAHHARLREAFIAEVKLAIRDEIETLTNKTVSFDNSM